jgi:hypothetical protein
LTALIGGIVGGIVALLLVGGLIAFLVTRSRPKVNHQDNNKNKAPTAGTSATAPYDRIPSKDQNYSGHVDTDTSTRNLYDTLTPSEL